MLSSTAASAAIPSFVVPATICAATPGCVEVVSNVVETVVEMCGDNEKEKKKKAVKPLRIVF